MTDPGKITSAINTICDRNLSLLKNNTPINTPFIQEWAKRLQILLQYESANIVHFLISDISCNLQDILYIQKCNSLLAKYANPLLSVTASTHDLSLILDISSIEQQIKHEIGHSPQELQEIMKQTICAYIQSGEELQVIDEELQKKLKVLDTVSASLHQLMTLEPSSITTALTDAVESYIHSIFEKNEIESLYKTFINAYGRFIKLRSIISIPVEIKSQAGPACTICMTKEITHAVTPCGHTFCSLCSEKQLTACYICRTQIRDRLRIYY